MICDTQSCIKKHNNEDGNIIMHKLPKDGAVRTTAIEVMLVDKKQ